MVTGTNPVDPAADQEERTVTSALAPVLHELYEKAPGLFPVDLLVPKGDDRRSCY